MYKSDRFLGFLIKNGSISLIFLHASVHFARRECKIRDCAVKTCIIERLIKIMCKKFATLWIGAMAEAYFDNKLKDASVNVQRRSKTYEAFARLPETFTSEDVMRCFGLTSDGAVRSKTRRLLSDHLIEKVSDGRGTTTGLSTFRKTGVQML